MIIDEKVVQMKFDNSGFRAGAEEAIGLIERLRAQLNFESITSTAGSLLGAMFDTVKDKCLAATSQVEKFAKSLTVDQISAGFDKYSEKITNVRTIMAATGEDIDTVDAAMERLMWYTDETSYNFSDMANSIGKFTAAGQGIDDSLTAMMGITNWAARSGQTKTQASMVMYNLSQALSTGALKLQDYKSIENANMATKEFKETAIQVALEMGKIEETTDGMYKAIGDDVKYAFDAITGFRDNLSRGWFDTDVIMGVLATYGSFSDTLNKIVNETGVEATTWMGILNKWTGSQKDWTAAMEETGLTMEELSPIIETLTSDELALSKAAFSAGQEATKFSESIDATKDAVSTQFMKIFESIFGDYEEARIFWTDVTGDLWTIFAGPITELADQFSAWHDNNGRTLLMEGLYSIRDGVFNVQKDLWEALDWSGITSSNLGQVSYWVKGVGEQFKSWTENTDKVTRWGEVLRKTLEIVTSLGKDLWNVLKPLFEGLAKISGSVLNGVLDWFEKILGISGTNAQSTFLEKLSEGSENLGRNLGDLCDKINSKVQPAFDLLGKLAEKIKMAIEDAGKVLSSQGKFIDRHLIVWLKELIDNISRLLKGELFDKGVEDNELTMFITKWKDIGTKLGKAVEPIIEKLKDFKSKLHNIFSIGIFSDGRSLSEFVENFDYSGFAFKVTDMVDDLIDSAKKLQENVTDKVMSIKDKITDFVDTAKTKFDEFKNKFDEVIEKITGFSISDKFTSLGESFKSLFGGEKDNTIDISWTDGTKTGIITGLKDAFEGLGNLIIAIGPSVESAGKAFGTGLSKIFAPIKSLFGGDGTPLNGSDSTFSLLSALIEKIKSFGEKIKKFMDDSGAIEAIKNFAILAGTVLKNTFTTIINAVNSFAKNSITAVGEKDIFEIIDLAAELMASFAQSKIATTLPMFLQIGKNLGLTNEDGESILAQPFNALKDILVGAGLIKDVDEKKKLINLPKVTINIEQVTKLMAALAVLVGEVIILAGYPAEDLGKAVLTLAGVAAVFTAMEKILASGGSINAKEGTGRLLDSIGRLVDAGAIAIIAKAVIDLTTNFVGLAASSEFSENDWDDLAVVIGSALAALLMIMAAFVTMKEVEGKNDKGWNSISKSISTFIDAGALKIIASAITDLASFYVAVGTMRSGWDDDRYTKAILGSVAALSELMVAIYGIQRIGGSSSKAKTFVNAVSTLITGGAMKVIAKAIKMVTETFKDVADDPNFNADQYVLAIWGSIAAIGELIGALVWVNNIVGKESASDTFKTAISTFITSAGMAIIAKAITEIVSTFGDIASDPNFNADQYVLAIWGSIAAIGELIAAMVWLNNCTNDEYSYKKTLFNGLSLLISSGGMLVIGEAIKGLVKLYADIASDEDIDWTKFGRAIGASVMALVELIAALGAISIIQAGKTGEETLDNAIASVVSAGSLLIIGRAIKQMMSIYEIFAENPDADWEDFGIATVAMLASLEVLLAGMWGIKKITESEDGDNTDIVDEAIKRLITLGTLSTLGKCIKDMMDIYETVMKNPDADWEDFGIASCAIAVALVTLMTGFAGIKHLNDEDNSNMDTVLTDLVSTGILLSLGTAIKQVVSIYDDVMSNPDADWEGFGIASCAIAVALAALLVGFAGIKHLNDEDNANIDTILTDIVSTGILLTLATAIKQMMDIYDTFKDVPTDDWSSFEKGTAAMLAGLTTLLLGFKGLKTITEDDDSIDDALSNLINGGTLILLSTAILECCAVYDNFPVDKEWGELGKAALGMIVAMAILIAGVGALDAIGKGVGTQGALNGLLNAGTMTLLAGSLIEVGFALQMIDGMDPGSIAAKLGITMGIMLGIATAGGALAGSPLGVGMVLFAGIMDMLGIAAVAFGYSVKLMADGIVAVIDAFKGFKGTENSTDELVNGAEAAMNLAANNATDTVETTAEDMVKKYEDAFLGMEDKMYELGEKCVTSFKDGVADGASTSNGEEDSEISTLTSAITKWLEKPLNSFIASVKKTTSTDTQGGGKWYAKIRKAGADTISAFGDGLENTKLSGKIFDAIADDITTQIANKKSTIEQAGKDLHDYLEDGFDYNQFELTALMDVLCSFQSLDYEQDGQVNWAQSFKLAGSDAGFFWEQGFLDRIKLITYEKMSPSFTSMFTALGTVKVKAKTAAISIGEYIVAGIIEGIENKKTDLETAIHNVAVSANEVFTNTEEIASPSKVYIRYGQFMVEGLAKGLSNTKPINTAMKNLTVTTNNLADEITGTLADPARWTIVIDADTTSADAKIADLASRFEVVSDAITSETTEDKSPREVYRLDGSSYTYIPDLATAVALANQNGEKKTLSAMEAFALSSERAATAIRKSSIKTENTTESTDSKVVNLTVNNNITGQSVEQITNEVKRSLAADLKKKGALLGK